MYILPIYVVYVPPGLSSGRVFESQGVEGPQLFFFLLLAILRRGGVYVSIYYIYITYGVHFSMPATQLAIP